MPRLVRIFKVFFFVAASVVIILGISGFLIFKTGIFPGAAFQCVAAWKSIFGVKNHTVTGPDGWLFFQPEISYVARPLVSSNIDRMIGFDTALREHGMVLFVVPVPNKIDIYPEKFCPQVPTCPVKKGRLKMIRSLESAGVRVIDLVPSFVQASRDTAVFDKFDSHWTPFGIELAARVIAGKIDSALAARGMIRKTCYFFRDTVLQGCGDLLEKITGDRSRAWYPLTVRQVYGPDGTLFSDDKKSDILILGDSFADRCRSWSAHLGAQLARLIGRPTRTYCSLLANTDGPCLYQARPALFPRNGIVIWVFSSRTLQDRFCGGKRGPQRDANQEGSRRE